MGIVTLNRTLDQELMALMRGASLECPACGEFVLHRGRGDRVPGVRLGAQEGRRGDATLGRAGRVTAGRASGSRKVRTPQGRTLGKSQAAKADGKWHRKETATGETNLRRRRR